MTQQKELNSQQLQAIQHGKGPLLIIAGAGTGKTTVITERIKYLILEKKINPSNILALTFTEKAASEMEERVDIAMPYGYTQMWISTFHAFCDKILRTEAIHIGLTPGYKLATEAESILFLRKNLFNFTFDYFRPLGNPYKFLDGLLQHFSRLKDEDITPDQYLTYAQKISNDINKKLDIEEIKKISELANAFKTYEELKIKEGMMDFSDLISNTLKLFRTRKNILKNYQDQFRYILIDEFQDTNYAQNELAILLTGQNRNITALADDDQAIFRWRGASISNIIHFRKIFPKTKIISLIKNYRSTQTILNNSYKLIQFNNPDRLEIREQINKKLISQRKISGEPLDFLFADRVENEAELVTKKIKELMKKGKYNYNDFAILVRANDYSQPFLRSFERAHVPYQFLGPGQLFHQEEVKDLIAYLKVLYNFEDTPSLYRILHMPIFNLSARDIAVLLNYAKRKNLTLFETMENIDELVLTDETKKRVKKISHLMKKHMERISKDTAGQILYYFLENTGYLQSFINPKNALEEKRAQNIARFFDKLKTFEAEHKDASVFAVIDWIDIAMQMGESPLAANMDWTNNNAVNILTVHSSKGLEFPVVFVVNAVSQRFPSRERREQIPIPQELIKEILPEGDYHLQEERRLFYVAMTRARDYLFLSASNYYGEGKRERKISPFIFETLGEEVVKKKKENILSQTKQLSLLDMFPQSKEQSILSQNSNYQPVTFLSYSQIQTFEICPLHYKLKYLLKIPTPPTSSLAFGTSVHAALKDFYQKKIRKETVDVSHIQQILKTIWIDEGYTSRSHEQAAFHQGVKIITNYLKNNFNTLLPLAIELPFKFSIKNLKIGGRIDRIDGLDNGKIEILDYKTGANVPEEKDLKNNLQLSLYALAATEVKDPLLYKRPEDVVLSLFFLEENKKITTTRTREQLEEVKEILLQKAEEIMQSDFICNKSSFCFNCEYKMLCNAH